MKKKVIISISSVLLVLIIIFLLAQTIEFPISTEVKIYTNKNTYEEGEEIEINVYNGLNEGIFYDPTGNQFWDIEYYEEGEWKKFGYSDNREGFQLTDFEIGEECYFYYYEQVLPEQLNSKEMGILNYKWSQVICPFGDEPSEVRYIGAGEYRLVFNYGFELSENEEYIIDYKSTYSNNITIKGGENTDPSEVCINFGGNWIEEYSECESQSSDANIKGFCEELNGNYNECDSACRHEKGDFSCIAVCVQVCSI